MRCPQLLLVCWCSSILSAAPNITVDRYSCLTSYWRTVSCVLNITPQRQSSNYSLIFTHTLWKDSTVCPLVMMNDSYSCVCELMTGSAFFRNYDNYNIDLCHKSSCYPVSANQKPFFPADNIQLTPPHAVEVQQTAETINITWRSGYEGHMHLADVCIDYEVLLESPQGSKTLRPECATSISVQRSQLPQHVTYCVRVRSIPPRNLYVNPVWSRWSPSTCEKNGEAFSEQDNILVILGKALGPVCVAVGVLLFIFYSPAARMKIKTLSHTPSPAPFFQPLFQQHEGNLQEWLSPQGKFMLTYTTEEILIIDSVSAVPKAIPKDPEENQDLNNPPVTQLQFTQCQSSYVGLPGIHEAAPPLTAVCPGDLSYTQLPCSVWGVGFGEVEIASSPPEDILNLSSADSGCSCDDLTQSLECSLPTSPVDVSPPPCSCTDYCILNKTAEGFAPVLVSKGDNLNVPSDSLQEEKS